MTILQNSGSVELGGSTFQGDGQYAARRDRLLDVVKANQGAQLGLRKDTSNLFRDPARTSRQRLDVRSFNHVITVDAEAKLIEAEGMTTYEDLVAATLACGVLPPVVPELKSITLGGAVAGVGIEASSFKYGLVHESLIEFDVLTGGGRILTCRPDNDQRDLFFGFPNSYGTLGYALKLTIGAISAKPYVELRHRGFADADACFAALEQECLGGADFIDGVAFGPGQLYLITGRFVESRPTSAITPLSASTTARSENVKSTILASTTSSGVGIPIGSGVPRTSAPKCRGFVGYTGGSALALEATSA